MARVVALTPMAVLRVVLVHVLVIVAIPSALVAVVTLVVVVVVVAAIAALVILLLFVVGIAVKVDLKVLFGHFSRFDARGTGQCRASDLKVNEGEGGQK